MATLEEYANKYETVNFHREDGILQVTFHSGGGSLKWGGPAHREFGYAFTDIGSDPENKVVILTGTVMLGLVVLVEVFAGPVQPAKSTVEDAQV